MRPQYEDFWERSRDSVRAAKAVVSLSPNTAASRSYYAAFYAVSAHFRVEGVSFKKHSAVEAAVHRDLVLTGRIPPEIGSLYSQLVKLRDTGDYGIHRHVQPDEAARSIEMAISVLKAVQALDPDKFKGLDE